FKATASKSGEHRATANGKHARNGVALNGNGHGAERMTRAVLNESQFVPTAAHKTPASIMRLSLPKRIRALIKLHGTPLLVLDKHRLIAEYNRFRKLLPRVRLYYAIKANP